MNQQEIFEFIKSVASPNIIAIPKSFIKIFGIKTAVVLSQLLYWSDKGKINNMPGWFAKSNKELAEETELSIDDIKKAKNSLIKKGIINEKIYKFKGVPTSHYSFNIDVLLQSIGEFFTNQSAKNSPNDRREIHQSYTIDYNNRIQQENTICNQTKLITEKKTEICDNKQDKDSKKPNKFNAFLYFLNAYEKKIGRKYISVNNQKEARLCKLLLNKLGQEQYCRAVNYYFEMQDEFIKKNKYSIPIFSTKINQVIAELDEKTRIMSEFRIPTVEDYWREKTQKEGKNG